MRVNLLLALLLMATGVAQTDKKPGAEQPAGAPKTQVKTAAVRGQKKTAQAKTKAPQQGAAEAQAEPKKAQGQAEAAQVETETGETDEAHAQTDEALAQTDKAQAQTDKDPKLTSVPGGNALGMSVLGNQEAPTSLVIVPWKSSEVGRATGISPLLDDSRRPVDKEVFMRELRYYEIRSEKKQ
jgi:hypothetical protein